MNSYDQELTLDDVFEIRKPSALEEAEKNGPEPEKRAVRGLNFSERLRITEAGIKVSKDNDWDEQRTGTTRLGIMGTLAFREETVMGQ